VKNVFLSFSGLLIALLAGCAQERSVPEGILPTDKMVSILTDIHELETKVANLKLTYDSSTLLYKQQQDSIFKKHQVTDSVYTESFDYYLQQVELLDQIYAAVVDSLSLRRNVGVKNEDEKTVGPQ